MGKRNQDPITGERPALLSYLQLNSHLQWTKAVLFYFSHKGTAAEANQITTACL